MAGCTIALSALVGQAAASEVRFDAPLLVSCRDVTTAEFVAHSPQQRLMEARFQISARAVAGAASPDLLYVYQFVNPTGTVQIVDYEPRSSQATPVAGNVRIEQHLETSKSLDASVSGLFPPFAQGAAEADLVENRNTQIRYELKPPLEVILVAGTVQRSTGVYFKLLPQQDAHWEGAREFVIVMQVSSHWRGDIMYVRCEAQQDVRGRIASRGVSRFVVGLHVAGDDEVRGAAEDLSLAEQALRRTVTQRQRDISRRALPTVVHRVGAWLEMCDPRIPDTWLDRLVYGAANLGQYEFVDHLPGDVRQLADRYVEAKRRMYQYSGKRLTARQGGMELSAR